MKSLSFLFSPFQNRSLAMALIFGLCATVASAGIIYEPCKVKYISSTVAPSSWHYPLKILLNGTYIYELGSNNISIYNNFNPRSPILAGETYNYTYTCGDSSRTTLDTALFPGDTILFLTTMCHGIKSYDIDSDPDNPPNTGQVNLSNIQGVASLKIGSMRYLIIPRSPWLYINFTNPGSPDQVMPFVVWNGAPNKTVSQMHAFAWQGHAYLAIDSLMGGFALYDVSNFPNAATLVFDEPDLRSWGSAFSNGILYVNGRSGITSRYGLEMFSVPSGQHLGTYQGEGAARFARTEYVRVDDRFAYLGLGYCPQSNGFDIVDISNPASPFSILPPGFVPEFCNTLNASDFVPVKARNQRYFMVAGSPEGDVYSLIHCDPMP